MHLGTELCAILEFIGKYGMDTRNGLFAALPVCEPANAHAGAAPSLRIFICIPLLMAAITKLFPAWVRDKGLKMAGLTKMLARLEHTTAASSTCVNRAAAIFPVRPYASRKPAEMFVVLGIEYFEKVMRHVADPQRTKLPPLPEASKHVSWPPPSPRIMYTQQPEQEPDRSEAGSDNDDEDNDEGSDGEDANANAAYGHMRLSWGAPVTRRHMRTVREFRDYAAFLQRHQERAQDAQDAQDPWDFAGITLTGRFSARARAKTDANRPRPRPDARNRNRDRPLKRQKRRPHDNDEEEGNEDVVDTLFDGGEVARGGDDNDEDSASSAAASSSASSVSSSPSR